MPTRSKEPEPETDSGSWLFASSEAVYGGDQTAKRFHSKDASDVLARAPVRSTHLVRIVFALLLVVLVAKPALAQVTTEYAIDAGWVGIAGPNVDALRDWNALRDSMELEADNCALACRAFESLARATIHVCRLNLPECNDARVVLRRHAARISAECPDCRAAILERDGKDETANPASSFPDSLHPPSQGPNASSRTQSIEDPQHLPQGQSEANARRDRSERADKSTHVSTSAKVEKGGGCAGCNVGVETSNLVPFGALGVALLALRRRKKR